MFLIFLNRIGYSPVFGPNILVTPTQDSRGVTTQNRTPSLISLPIPLIRTLHLTRSSLLMMPLLALSRTITRLRPHIRMSLEWRSHQAQGSRSLLSQKAEMKKSTSGRVGKLWTREARISAETLISIRVESWTLVGPRRSNRAVRLKVRALS